MGCLANLIPENFPFSLGFLFFPLFPFLLRCPPTLPQTLPRSSFFLLFFSSFFRSFFLFVSSFPSTRSLHQSLFFSLFFSVQPVPFLFFFSLLPFLLFSSFSLSLLPPILSPVPLFLPYPRKPSFLFLFLAFLLFLISSLST